MEIVGVEPLLVRNVPPLRGGPYWILTKLMTDEGIERIDEWTAGSQTGRESSQIELIENLGKRFVIGSDPFKIETLWQRMYAYDHDYRHPDRSC